MGGDDNRVHIVTAPGSKSWAELPKDAGRAQTGREASPMRCRTPID